MDENTIQEPTPEEKAEMLDLIEICLSFATVFGQQLNFYGRGRLRITFDGDTEADQFAEGPAEEDAGEESENPDDMDLMDYDEDIQTYANHGEKQHPQENPEPIFQMAQIFTLLHPRVKQIYGEKSAIYEIFSKALQLRGATGDTIEQQINGANRTWVISTWILAKQVFALHHFQEIFPMIDALRNDPVEREPMPMQLSGMSDKDLKTLTELCEALRKKWGDPAARRNAPAAAGEAEDATALRAIAAEQIQQIKASDIARIPLAKAFWQQPEIARAEKAKPKKVEVYEKPNVINDYVMITDTAGNPTEISGFDMALSSALGQIFQENGNIPPTFSPATLYRKCAGLGSGAAVSQKDIELTTEALLRISKNWVSIVYEEHLAQFKKTHKSKASKPDDVDYKIGKLEGAMINIERHQTATLSPNGRIISDTFTLLSLPILYKYSYMFKQIMDVDTKYLAPALGKATPDNIAFARYILAQINRIKKEPDKDKLLTFETIAKRSTYDISSRSKLRNFQQKVMNYLNNLAEMGHIKKAEPHYDGKKLTGIDITV